jgi:RHS repeat-associated protein
MSHSLKSSSLLIWVLIFGLLPLRATSGERKSPHSRPRNARPFAGSTGQTATLLPDGRTLLVGGDGPHGVVSTVAIKDPQTGSTTELKNGLIHARAWHTATLLPDGTVLVFGGQDDTKGLVSPGELFNPVAEQSSEVLIPALLVRAHHSATLLTDGTVLVAGGVDSAGDVLRSLQSWSPQTGTVETLATSLLTPRRDQKASLNDDGSVLFWGGISSTGTELTYGEVFDPSTGAEQIVASLDSLRSNRLEPFVETSIPSDGAINISVNPLVAVRFSKPLAVQSVNATTVTLSLSGNAIAAKVVPAEGGMLAFLTPVAALNTGTSYTLEIVGAQDPSGNQIQPATVVFTTGGSSGTGAILGSTSAAGGANDETGPLDNTAFRLPSLRGANGQTALAGQVLKLSGRPLIHVLLQIDDQTAYTDGMGRFLLENITPGHHAMVIDGSTANHDSVEYGIYDDGVDVESGQTTVLNYPIWMTPLDRKHEVSIPSPTTSEFVVTNPSLPGLELHLPPNTVIRDRNGNVVTRVSITPIPVNQPPFPLPRGVGVPIYFTIQPGGAFIDMPAGTWAKGAQLYYPNWHKAKPGTPFDFWNYDPLAKGWYVYGEGKVSPNGSTIIPNKGVEIYQFTGAMYGSQTPAPDSGPCVGDYNPLTKECSGGDPVDLSTGLFVHRKTDLVLPDIIPIDLERTYRTQDSVSRPFGIGASDSYEMFLIGDTSPYTYAELILSDGERIYFYRTSSGTGFSNAVYAHTATPGSWYGATITNIESISSPPPVTNTEWVLRKRDGTQYCFPDGIGQTAPGLMGLLGIVDRNGNVLTITRDANGNKTKITSPNGRYIAFQNDSTNRITQAQDNSGRTVQYQYDAIGRLSQVTDAAGGTWQYTYDSNNNMLTLEDARGITYLTNAYDSGGHVIQQTQADGSTNQFSWTLTSNTAQPPFTINGGTGNLPPGGSSTQILNFRNCSDCSESYAPLVSQVDVTDPRGYVRRVTFSATGYPATDTRAYGQTEQQTTTFQYYADNLGMSATDALGRTTAYVYDSNGNTTSTTRLSGTSNAVATSATYDTTFSEVQSATDALNHTTNFGYDTNGNLTSITDPLSHQTTLTYTAQGQLASASDAAGNTSRYFYSSGDLVGASDPLGRTIIYIRDGLGRSIASTDSLGQTTRLTYDVLNQTSSITDPLKGVTSFTYDPNGNLLSVTDANNHTTTYTYNNMDRLATRTDPLTNAESYQYDGNGNQTQFTDRRGKVAVFTYDGINRQTFAGYGQTTGPTYESTVTNTYDAGNRLTQAVDSISGTITRGYDGLDRLTSETTPGSNTVSYTYDAAGRRTSLTVPGQSAANYSFDNANRLTQISQGSTTVSFGYDNINRRTTLTLPNGITTSYSYDNASELIGLTYANGSTTLGNLTYAYDLAGRRINVAGSYAPTNLPLAVSTTAYNADNQLTTWGTANLYYDANGNMTSDGTHSYTWDARNRLSQIDSGTTASFTYDPFKRRTSKTITSTQTGFLYDRGNPVQELSGSAVTANSLMGGIDEAFQRTDSSGARSFLTDALGSTLGLTDQTGTVQTTYSFDAFGDTTTSGSSTTNSFGYTGRELDGTGLYYYRARYYNPSMGRFLSEDPIGLRGGFNRYAYVADSPTRYIDPSGMDKCRDGESPVGVDFTSGLVVQAGAGWGAAGLGGGGSFSYVPSTGGVFATGAGGPSSPGWSIFAVAGPSTTTNQAGPSTTTSGFFGVGASQSYFPSGDTTTGFGLGSPSASLFSGKTVPFFSIPPIGATILCVQAPLPGDPDLDDPRTWGATY